MASVFMLFREIRGHDGHLILFPLSAHRTAKSAENAAQKFVSDKILDAGKTLGVLVNHQIREIHVEEDCG